MLRRIQKILLGAFVAIQAAPAIAEWTSVWETTRMKTYSVEGRIKAILINEENNQILVRVKQINSSDSQTLKVCSGEYSGDLRNWQTSERMALLRQAFARGDVVRLGYSGSFDRCLSSIEYNAPTETARKASGTGSI